MTGEGYVFSDGRASGLPEDLVAEVAGVLRYYGCDQGSLTDDAAAHAILAARSWHEREAAEERRHAKARQRLAEEAEAIEAQIAARRVALARPQWGERP